MEKEKIEKTTNEPMTAEQTQVEQAQDENTGDYSDSGLQIYKRLLGYVKPYRTLFAISILGFLIYSLTQASFGYVIEQFIKALRLPEASSLYFVPVLVVVLAAARGASFFMANYSMSRVTLGVINDLRKEVFEKMLFLPSRYYDARNSAELVSLITFNINQVSNSTSTAVKIVFREGFTVIALLVYLFYQNWKLTAIFLLVAPFMAGIVAAASHQFRKHSKRIQSSMGDLAHITSESVGGYRLVRGYGGEPYEQERFDRASERNTNQGVRFNLIHSLQTPVLQFILSLAIALVMLLVLMIEGSPEEHVAYIVMAGLLARPIRALTQVNGQIQRGLTAAQSIFDVIDSPSEVDDGQFQIERARGDLAIEGLWFRYNPAEAPVLRDINLTIAAGKTVALVGRSGSGKSTLSALISRFYEPEFGRITLDGVPLSDYRLGNLRRQIALVSQHVTLFNCTVAENIAYGHLSGSSREQIRAAAVAAHALDFIEQLPEGFDTLIGEDGLRLSGGQRQRISIARALLKNAPVLILDEATSALDTESERQIQAALNELMKNRTTIVIAHRLSTIENADTIVVMEAGEVVESGTHAELLERGGAYARLHSSQELLAESEPAAGPEAE
ncbi:lipid A export permease/ATP-binding protein MsbA [Halioxenophilus sp. WMMB6]|uniref:lipid A export permease/ATP-binding protein MsbA n=1 Tax=Halioxenophilus sp. WMMB6 TaxID=3073815 RepID=UPI00295E7749|nr:lipid A export permease/ATP-binding protein MsbA [Halioxenophilus sp. WMMB6]